MNIGMLWFDNNPNISLNSKISTAAAYYRGKYGRDPNLCFAHPSMLNGYAGNAPAGIEIRAKKSVLPNHIWLGCKSEERTPTP